MYIVGRGTVWCNIQKSIRIDKYTYDIINSYRGKSFSDKLRNYVYDVEHKCKRQVKCNTSSAD